MTVYNVPQLAGFARGAGFTGDAVVMAVAIAIRESRGDAAVIGDIDNPHAGCRSYGLMQINVCPGGHVPGGNAGTPWRENPTLLLDPLTNMRAAYSMSNGGTSWGPWSTYRAGIPAPDLDAVRRQLGNSPSAPVDAPEATPVDDPAPDGLGGLVHRLTSWETWRSVLYILGGAGLITLGLGLINRDLVTGLTGIGGASTDAPAPAANIDPATAIAPVP